MTDPVKVLLQQQGLKASHFSPTSRYYSLATATFEVMGKDPVLYVQRRIIPPQESFQFLKAHTVSQGERLDNIAHQYLGDPEQFWQICDANAAMDPNELTETIGQKIKITLPTGVPGNSNA